MPDSKSALRKIPFKFSTLLAFLGLGAILIANAWEISQIAFRGFNFFDYSAFLDSSWRVYRGQKIYIDFYFHTGPLHLYLNALFFLLFGFGKTAILAHMLTLSSILTVLTFLVARKRMPAALALLAAGVSAVGSYYSWPHPFYDVTAHFFGLLGTLALAWQLPFQTPRRALWTSAACGIAAGLSLMTKTNVGGAYGIAFFTVLLYSPLRWRALAGYLAGALICVAAVFACCIPSWQSYYLNAYEFYAKWRSNQLQRFLFLPVWFKNLYWLPFFAVLFSCQKFKKHFPELFTLFLATCAVGLFTLNTSSRRDWDHIPDMGVYVALGLILLYRALPLCVSKKQKAVTWLAIAALIFTAGLQIKRCVRTGIQHYQNIGHGYPHGNYPLKAKPLRGWLFHESIGPILDDMASYIRANVPAGESLLILCDMQILNPLTGRDGYKGVPFIWHAGEYPRTEGGQIDLINATLKKNPPDWLLISSGPGIQGITDYAVLFSYLRFPPDFLGRYSLAKSWGPYALLRRHQI
jgi:hypothetical protein